MMHASKLPLILLRCHRAVAVRAGVALTAALALVLLLAGQALAYTPPPIEGHVTDKAGKLSADDLRYLEDKLEKYRLATTNEIAVFLVASLGNETIDDVAYGTFNTWKLGAKGKDNGVLI